MYSIDDFEASMEADLHDIFGEDSDFALEGFFKKTDEEKAQAAQKKLDRVQGKQDKAFQNALAKAEKRLRKRLKTKEDCSAYMKEIQAEGAKYNDALRSMASIAKKEQAGKLTREEAKAEMAPHISFLKKASNTLMINVYGTGAAKTTDGIKALGNYISSLKKIVSTIASDLKSGGAMESAFDWVFESACDDDEECDKKKKKSDDDDEDEDEDDDDDTDSKKKKKKKSDDDDEDEDEEATEAAKFIRACESMMIYDEDTIDMAFESAIDDLLDTIDSLS